MGKFFSSDFPNFSFSFFFFLFLVLEELLNIIKIIGGEWYILILIKKKLIISLSQTFGTFLNLTFFNKIFDTNI